MTTENVWKERINKLYRENPYIHIDVTLERPHIEMKNVEVRIVGVYKHIFQIEAENKGMLQKYSLQYGDIGAGIVKIAELRSKQ